MYLLMLLKKNYFSEANSKLQINKSQLGERNTAVEKIKLQQHIDLRCFNVVISWLNIYLRGDYWDLHLSEIHLSMVTMHLAMKSHDHEFVVVCSRVCLCCEIEMIDCSVPDSVKSLNSHRRYNRCKNRSNTKLHRRQSHFQFKENTETSWMRVNVSEYPSRLTGWWQRINIPALFWTWRKETCRRPETAARWCQPPSCNYPTVAPPVTEKQLTSA